MDISMVTVTIYFVGIAAVTNAPPHESVAKSIIFPATPADVDYQGTPLTPHQAWLYLRVRDLASEEAAANLCDRLGGTYISGANTVCRVPLNGARLWTRSSDPLLEDDNFRKIPSFMNHCSNAKNLPDGYLNDVNPDFVAARFDIRGGTMGGCNRNGQAFVTSLVTKTNDGTLYLDQAERTVRIVLKDRSAVTIENQAASSAAGTHQHSAGGHFGWYYQMNSRTSAIATGMAPCTITTPKNPVAGVPFCPFLPGADDQVVPAAAASAECSVVNFP